LHYRIPEGEEKGKGIENKIVSENFPNLHRHGHPKIQPHQGIL
jgi:hypothetical protein